MFEIEKISGEDKTEFYKELNTYLEAGRETDWLAVCPTLPLIVSDHGYKLGRVLSL